MGWMNKLYETYDFVKTLDLPDDNKLVPISHKTQNAHINIILDKEGNFIRAKVIKQQIILPATESSASRANVIAPHPLADNLEYVAGDYSLYCESSSKFEQYEKLIGQWCKSEYCNPKVEAVYKYISKKSVIKDLISANILFLDDKGKLLNEWAMTEGETDNTPPLIKILTKTKGKFNQTESLICWSVEEMGVPQSDTWVDSSVFESWSSFYNSKSEDEGFCFVSGKIGRLGKIHPKYIRNPGDNAKIVSSNDGSGFVFRGRFLESDMACTVGYEVSQKAHNALKWLINRQSFTNGDQVVLAWVVKGIPIPDPFVDSWSFLDNDELLYQPVKEVENNQENGTLALNVGQTFSHLLKKKILGYNQKLKENDDVMIIGLDSATPGRICISYYKEQSPSNFFNTIESWHIDFCWWQRHVINIESTEKKKKTKVVWPVSSPNIRNVMTTAFGENLTDTLKKNIFQRLLPCILEGKQLPIDILLACFHNVCKPHNYENWEWEEALGITCALFKGFYIRNTNFNKRRNYLMSLEENYTARDYLFGRLLAVAEKIEEIALQLADEKRPVTAIRLMQRFADRPSSTWRNIELGIQPYMQRLQSKRTGFLVNRKKDLDQILSLFQNNDFNNDKPLSGEFLLGFHCQRMVLNKKQEQETTEIETN